MSDVLAPAVSSATLHGYRVTRLDGPLPWLPTGPVAAAGGRDAAGPGAPEEMVVGVGAERPVPDAAPPGDLLAHLEDPGRGTFYSFAAAPGRTVLRFHGAVEFHADPALTRVEAHLAPGFDPGIVDVLVGGTLMAARLVLDGRLVLHASAISVPARGAAGGAAEQALAFVGAPGMGKSTMAGLGAAAGFPLVTDDVLRCDVGAPDAPDAPVTVWPGAAEVRLRETSRDLAAAADPASVRRTADDRLAVRAGRLAAGPLPLRAVVIPVPDPGIRTVSVQRLPVMEAVRALGAFPRIIGWRHEATRLLQFHLTVDLCGRVPVYVADLPWGPPFRATVVDELLDRLAAAS